MDPVEFKASLDYRASSRISRATQRDTLSQKSTKKAKSFCVAVVNGGSQHAFLYIY